MVSGELPTHVGVAGDESVRGRLARVKERILVWLAFSGAAQRHYRLTWSLLVSYVSC